MSGHNYDAYNTGFDGSGGQQMGSGDNPNSLMMDPSGMMAQNMMQGQSLDDIVDQNAKLLRRQSVPHSFHRQQSHTDMATMGSMMEFSSGSPAGPLENFAFDPSTALEQDHAGNLVPQMQQGRATLKKSASGAALSGMGSPYPPQLTTYNSMMSNSSSFASPIHVNPTMDMDSHSPFGNSAMAMQMDFGDGQLSMSNNAFSNTSPYQQNKGASPAHAGGLSHSMHNASKQDSAGGNGSDGRQSMLMNPSTHGRRGSFDASKPVRSQSLRQTNAPRSAYSHLSSASHHSKNSQVSQNSTSRVIRQHEKSSSFNAQPQNPARGSYQDRGMNDQTMSAIPQGFDASKHNPNNQGFNWETPKGGWPSTLAGKPHMNSVYKNAYSSTGFDMLNVLMKVATRPNPEINLGSVDLSCAFVVCDAAQDDFPIVYCSDNFQRLTGYTRHMILGRNCRFLQSPDGNVEPGVKRKYVDDDSVLYLKNMINARREAQISLINYRRGGQPFMNLLTMIPVAWDTGQVKFFVGFQVDLVEQPTALTGKNPDGTITVNYQRGMTMPRYVLNAPESTAKADLGQRIPRDDVSAILSTIGTGESEYAKRMWDKVLLENTDDVVHVLSLKGLFQWVSPSAAKVLEYEPGELIGTALSSVCHPSDIVPVTRELKDTSSCASVNIVYRIRRKRSGYMWFEGHGTLHTEAGKGRKSIIMVGRERPVYAISKADITANGGIGEYELWTKISTAGMFLYVSSNVRSLLDRQPEELVGTSIQALMRTDSKQDFGRVLEHARCGKRASAKHEMINRRGQVLQAFTTLYPGDATEGQKPTFIVAQTRFVKYSRVGGNKTGNGDRQLEDGAHPASLVKRSSQEEGTGTPGSRNSIGQYQATETATATYAGQHGLPLGKQDVSLAAADNLFDELKTTKSSSWQYEIRQLEKKNRMLAEEVQSLLAAKKKRKRRKGAGMQQKDCANCHTRVTPEWRRGPSGQRDLCNSCGLRWAKLNGRVSPRTNSQQSKHSNDAASDKASRASASPRNSISRTDDNRGSHSMATTLANAGQQSSSTSGQLGSPVVPPAATRQGGEIGHAAQMEGAQGVPSKIEETEEPD